MEFLFYGKIYMIKNNINKKVYIGQTVLDSVLHDRYGGNVEKHTHNTHLKNSIHKYGWDSFSITILEYCMSKNELNERERYWIRYFQATNPIYGYNIEEGGQDNSLSNLSKMKIGQALKQYWDTHPEEKEKRAQAMRGDNNFLVRMGGHTEEAKNKMRDIRLQMIVDNTIDMEKARVASMSPESMRKKVISRSKYWYIQYDLEMNELNRWHTLKDMYDYLVAYNIESGYKNYKSFKQKSVTDKVFFKDKYKTQGYYFKKIPKLAC